MLSCTFIEVTLTSISTTIGTTFACRDFGEAQTYLVAELSIKCSNNPLYSAWKAYAVVCFLAYVRGSVMRAHLTV